MVKRIITALTLILSLVIGVFGLATFFRIPMLLSIVNYITIGETKYWLPFIILSAIIVSVLFMKDKTNKFKKVSLGLVILGCVFSFITTGQFYASLNRAGANVSLLSSYRLQDLSDVTKEEHTYTTSEYGDVALNVYYTEDGKKDKPVIVHTHGGGWMIGTKDDDDYYLSVFAKNGYVVYSLNYDLSTADRHLHQTTEKQLIDGFNWAIKQAPQFNGNADKLFVTGGSAGGNLALETAYKINAGIYKLIDDKKVMAVSTFYPVASPKAFYDNQDVLFGKLAKDMVTAYIGATPFDNPVAYDNLTPKNFISDATPPTLFLSGTHDSLVPQEMTFELVQQ